MITDSSIQKVAIIGANRTPFAKANTAYADASSVDMLSSALDGLAARFELSDKTIGEVCCASVLKHNFDINLTKEALLNTVISADTPTYDISQACAGGMQAIFSVANKIALGIIDSGIAGGVDSASDVPIGLGEGIRKTLLRLNKAKNYKERLSALLTLNPKDLIYVPSNQEPRTHLSMGEHQAITTLFWQISRQDQDKLALSSHQKLKQAYQDGFFDDLITSYKGLSQDNILRDDSSLQKLAALPVVFGKNNQNPTMTAGNSSTLTDGAGVALLASESWAKSHQYEPMAYLTHQITKAVDFTGKQGLAEGLLMAPAYAVAALLQKTGLNLQDFDFYEIHEAFAAQVLCNLTAMNDQDFCQQRLGLDKALGTIDLDKLNVKGGSLATGHPFSATGARMIANAAKLLKQKGGGRALVVICAAGGQATACILER